MATVSIDYDEPKPETYRGVEFSGLKTKKRFDSGNLVKDWYDLIKFVYTERNADEDPFVMHSSSVNHFIMDGAPFDSAYLDFESGEFKYGDDVDHEKMAEHFVKEGTQPTWEDFQREVDPEAYKRKDARKQFEKTYDVKLGDDQLDQFVELYDKGKKIADIAKELGL